MTLEEQPRPISLSKFSDDRGGLHVGEFPGNLPFRVERFFTVSGVPSGVSRGHHAHRRCHQLLVAVSGKLTLHFDQGLDPGEVVLDRPDQGFLLPPMVWGVQSNFSRDAVLLVLCSRIYEPDDYIKDFDTFKQIVTSSRE
mgnify:CR=1 FL=1